MTTPTPPQRPRRPPSVLPPPPPTVGLDDRPPSRPFYRRTWFVITAVLVALFIVIGYTAPAPETTTVSSLTTAAPAAPTTSAAPATTTTAAPATTAAPVTTAAPRAPTTAAPTTTTTTRKTTTTTRRTPVTPTPDPISEAQYTDLAVALTIGQYSEPLARALNADYHTALESIRGAAGQVCDAAAKITSNGVEGGQLFALGLTVAYARNPEAQDLFAAPDDYLAAAGVFLQWQCPDQATRLGFSP